MSTIEETGARLYCFFGVNFTPNRPRIIDYQLQFKSVKLAHRNSPYRSYMSKDLIVVDAFIVTDLYFSGINIGEFLDSVVKYYIKLSYRFQIGSNKLEELAHRRHDIPDKLWHVLNEHLPSSEEKVGRRAADNRTFINAVLWILRTCAPWRDLPPNYGDWENTHSRFSRWRDRGLWESLLHIVMGEPDYEWLMMNASHCKVHPHAAGAKRGLTPRHT